MIKGAMDEIRSLYKEVFGMNPDKVEKIHSGGSHREYYRLSSGPENAVATVGTSLKENEAFIYLSRKFADSKLNVPEILAVNRDRSVYLQTDIGQTSLYDFLMARNESERFDETAMNLLEKVVTELVEFQACGLSKDFDYSICYPVEEMNRTAIMWDLNYFKYCFLKAAGMELDEPRLEREFDKLAEMCRTKDCDGFMYRDFQSRNILVGSNGAPGYIDYQGGRKGNGLYDLVSFLWQSRLPMPEKVRERLIRVYSEATSALNPLAAQSISSDLYLFALLRGLQNLGAYGLRGITERKEMFRQSIAKSLRNLSELPESVLSKFPYIRQLLSECRILFNREIEGFEGLTVTVGSFSYKKGLPDDPSGNGGGFVFDCRALDNPGRYSQYKTLTGRDQPVIEFLQSKQETEGFLRNTLSLVDKSIDEYIRRGFTSLSVWTGCTGGQHRSVYFADRIARHIAEKYGEQGVRIQLIHREQGIHQTIEPR